MLRAILSFTTASGPRIGLALLALYLGGVAAAFGQDSDRLVYPAEPASTKTIGSEEYSGPKFSLYSMIVIYGLLLVGGVALFYKFGSKGSLRLAAKGKSRQLRIQETRGLRNKQFLVVVEHEERRILLGVGPGFINHLCYLNDQTADSQTKYPGGEAKESR